MNFLRLNPHAPDRFTPSSARCAENCGSALTIYIIVIFRNRNRERRQEERINRQLDQQIQIEDFDEDGEFIKNFICLKKSIFFI